MERPTTVQALSKFNIAFINEPLPFIRKEAIAFSIVGITALQNRYARCVHHFVEFSGYCQILLQRSAWRPQYGKTRHSRAGHSASMTSRTAILAIMKSNHNVVGSLLSLGTGHCRIIHTGISGNTCKLAVLNYAKKCSLLTYRLRRPRVERTILADRSGTFQQSQC